MYSPAVAASLAISLLSALTTATPVATPVPQQGKVIEARQGGPTQDPNCSGLGIGLNAAALQGLVNQIDTSKVYNIPWDSTQNGWTGPTTFAGDPSMSCNFENSSGDGDITTTGTIDGDLLQSSFQALINSMSPVLASGGAQCFSQNGQYQFWTGTSEGSPDTGGP